MATMYKGFSMEDLMTEPNQDTINDMQEVMIRKAQELFRVCDKEEKGFINKKDMQRLRKELPVAPEQLEVVFDSLDEDGNGFLTLEEFTDGFDGAYPPHGAGNTMDPRIPDTQVIRPLYPPSFNGTMSNTLNSINHEIRSFSDGCVRNDLKDGGADEEMMFNDMLRNFGASNVFQDEDVIKAMWQKLYRESTDMSSAFEEFLGRLSDDIRKSKVDFKSLESALVSKSNEHEEEVRKLYEEMELQIKQERERILSEEKVKEKLLKSDMEKQLEDKERQLQELSMKHQEMEERLGELNMTETSTKQENERLQKEKDRLEELLNRSQDNLEESRNYIAQVQDQQMGDKRERARQAILLSEGIAIERESLVKQLDILKDVNKKLRDDKDEADATEARRVEQAALDKQAETGKRSGRKELQKQGSVLSKYFPSGRPPQSSSGSMDVDMSLILMECEDDDEDALDDFDDEVLKNANVFIPGNSPCLTTNNEFNFTNQTENELSITEQTENEHNFADHTDSSHHRLEHQQQSSPQQDKEQFQQLENNHATESSHLSSTSAIHNHSKEAMSSELGSTRSQPVGADAQTANTENQVPKPSRIFKVVIIGDSSVGKSTFIHRFCHQEFKNNFNATIGVDFQIKTMNCKDSTVILQLWDTAGQERFRSMTKTYFRKADGVIIMYDVTSEKTFMGVRAWMDSVKEQVEEGTVIALLGNKHDMSPDDAHRPVKKRDGLALAVENEAIFFETSAKSGFNIEESMEELAKLLQEKEDKKLEEGLHLSEDKGGGKRKCCGK